MTKEEMEEAVSEARELVALAEQGALLPDLAPEERKGSEALLRRILTKREAWLRGEIILASGVGENPDREIGRAVKNNLQSVEDGAEMFPKPQAIEYLRARNSLNHEPLRKIEQEWLDRIFIRERMSKGWIGLASVVATTEETGTHTEGSIGPRLASALIRWRGSGGKRNETKDRVARRCPRILRPNRRAAKYPSASSPRLRRRMMIAARRALLVCL